MLRALQSQSLPRSLETILSAIFKDTSAPVVMQRRTDQQVSVRPSPLSAGPRRRRNRSRNVVLAGTGVKASWF